MSRSIENPKKIITLIKKKLSNATKNRHHGFHTPIFSNLTLKGEINSRTVVLRKYDSKNNILYFHTDFRSNKIKEINKNPITFFIFYDFEDKTQLRIQAYSTIQYKNLVSEKAWEETLLSSRKCYLAKKAPGSLSSFPSDSIPLNLKGKTPNKEESEKGYLNFAVIENKIKNIEWLYLSSSGHRKLFIILENKKIRYQWIIP